jgi:hypothetical protein
MLGLGTKEQTAKKAPAQKEENTQKKAAAPSSQEDEAKAVLAKMEAKKDAGDCPFC